MYPLESVYKYMYIWRGTSVIILPFLLTSSSISISISNVSPVQIRIRLQIALFYLNFTFEPLSFYRRSLPGLIYMSSNLVDIPIPIPIPDDYAWTLDRLS